MLQSTCFKTQIDTGVDSKDDSGSQGQYREKRREVRGKMTLTVEYSEMTAMNVEHFKITATTSAKWVIPARTQEEYKQKKKFSPRPHAHSRARARVCVCVCVCARVCVCACMCGLCVCVRGRERERERERKRGRERVCVCVCERERERERELGPARVWCWVLCSIIHLFTVGVKPVSLAEIACFLRRKPARCHELLWLFWMTHCFVYSW